MIMMILILERLRTPIPDDALLGVAAPQNSSEHHACTVFADLLSHVKSDESGMAMCVGLGEEGVDDTSLKGGSGHEGTDPLSILNWKCHTKCDLVFSRSGQDR